MATFDSGRQRFPPHRLQRKRRLTSGATMVSASASTFTSATWPQASHLAMTARAPFWRMFASVIGGPKFLPRALAIMSHRACRLTVRQPSRVTVATANAPGR
jgi:hypothetical protein